MESSSRRFVDVSLTVNAINGLAELLGLAPKNSPVTAPDWQTPQILSTTATSLPRPAPERVQAPKVARRPPAGQNYHLRVIVPRPTGGTDA